MAWSFNFWVQWLSSFVHWLLFWYRRKGTWGECMIICVVCGLYRGKTGRVKRYNFVISEYIFGLTTYLWFPMILTLMLKCQSKTILSQLLMVSKNGILNLQLHIHLISASWWSQLCSWNCCLGYASVHALIKYFRETVSRNTLCKSVYIWSLNGS